MEDTPTAFPLPHDGWESLLLPDPRHGPTDDTPPLLYRATTYKYSTKRVLARYLPAGYMPHGRGALKRASESGSSPGTYVVKHSNPNLQEAPSLTRLRPIHPANSFSSDLSESHVLVLGRSGKERNNFFRTCRAANHHSRLGKNHVFLLDISTSSPTCWI